jgi:hypothetical protein
MRLFRILSKVFLYIVPVVIVFIFFYQRQEFKVTFGVSGIIVMLILFVKLYGKYKAWLLKKEQAHETARNLGMKSHTTNFIVIEICNLLFLLFPFAIILWVVYVMQNYDGRIYLPVIFIMISFAVSGLFNVLFRTQEQLLIEEETLKKQEQEIASIAQKVKEVLS